MYQDSDVEPIVPEKVRILDDALQYEMYENFHQFPPYENNPPSMIEREYGT